MNTLAIIIAIIVELLACVCITIAGIWRLALIYGEIALLKFIITPAAIVSTLFVVCLARFLADLFASFPWLFPQPKRKRK